jgi:hypothetical protein
MMICSHNYHLLSKYVAAAEKRFAANSAKIAELTQECDALKQKRESILEFPPFRGRFTAWDSSRALRWLGVQCWTYPPLVVDG